MNEEQPLNVRLFSMQAMPVGNLMIIKPIVEEVSRGGIHLPSFAPDAEARLEGPMQVGEVVRIGSEVQDFKPGDLIGYSHYAASKAKEGDDTVHVIEADSVKVKYESPVA